MSTDLDLEVALLEAEVDLLTRMADAGIVPPGARRQPTAGELRAGVLFAELDRIVDDAARVIADHADTVRATTLDALAEYLAPAMAEEDPYAVVRALMALKDPTTGTTLPGLSAVVDDAAAAIEETITATAHAGAAQVVDEAVRQGIPADLAPRAPSVLPAEVRQAGTTAARRVALAPLDRLLGAAIEAGTRAATGHEASGYDVVDAAITGAEDASTAGTEDLARQAANVAHGQGRTAAASTGPRAREVYASELLDRNTCGPCATVDGRTYRDLTAGLVDYPGAGGYVGCDGGSRCRGTLVIVWDTEAAPTLDLPGDNPGNTPRPDRTPRGPSGVGRPEHIGPDGAVIPLAPTVPAVDPHADPASRLDPDLADYTDDELRATLAQAEAAGSDDALEQAVRYADELDARAATTTRITLDPDEVLLDDWTGGTAGDYVGRAVTEADTYRRLTGAPRGRRVDLVKADWDLEVERTGVDAEAATNGNLIRADRAAEFARKYGTRVDVMHTGPARVAYYYASEELKAFWRERPRITFAEFAVQYGIDDAKTLERARKAATARQQAEAVAEEDPARRAARKAAADKERRRRGLK